MFRVRGFNSAVAACEEEGAWEAALGLLRELAARRLLDVVSAVAQCDTLRNARTVREVASRFFSSSSFSPIFY